MMPNSLRSRLVLVIGVVQLLTWLAICTVGGLHLRNELEEGYNVELIQFATSVGALVDALEATGKDGSASHPVAQTPDTISQRDLPRGISTDDFKDHLVQVSNNDTVIFRSSTAPTSRIDIPDGINTVTIGNDRWKALRKIDPKNGDEVVVAIRRHEVNTTIIATLASVLVPLAGAAVLSMILTFFLVSRLLKPLERWAHEIGSLSPYGAGSIDDDTALSEVRPVLAAVNRMLDRVRASVAFERRFVQDAAHELRTPLTAIRTQIEAGDWSGLSEKEQQRMTNVRFGLMRASRLVNQLMDLARAEEPRTPARERRIEVGAFVSEKLTDLINGGSISDPGRLSLTTHHGAVWLTSAPHDLEIMLVNVVDNAIKFAGEKAVIAISLVSENDWLKLIVEDNGPGIPASKRVEVLDRFVRLAPASSPGSGLGLSLVREIATKLGGDVVLDQSETLYGLSVIITLPIEAEATLDKDDFPEITIRAAE